MGENKEIMDLVQKMSGGNADLITKAYYDRMAIEMRLIGSDIASTETSFLGRELKTPIMAGVIGYFPSMGEDAVEQAALAVKDLGSVLWLSNYESDEEVAGAVATGANVVRIIKPYGDLGKWKEELLRSEALGCMAVGTDVDHAFSRDGGYDGDFRPKTAEELRDMAKALKIPFIIKGILSVRDALIAKELGAAAILLSHHHNIMRFAVPPAKILPEVRAAVGPDYPVIVDSGIVSGAEAFKALALGASGVCVARPFMVPLANERREGVVKFFSQMNGELTSFMNRTDIRTISDMTPDVIHFM